MSRQGAAVDYEKQYQDDLAKATALSLEQQALDDYRRKKKYGSSNYSRGVSIETSPPSFATGHRRHSEVTNLSSAAANATAFPTATPRERSKTPPASLPEGDLISFSSNPTAANRTNVDGIVSQSLPHQHPPTAAPQTFMPTGGVAAPIYMNHGYIPTATHPAAMTALQTYASHTGSGGSGGMQLVPFRPTTPPQKQPLTNEELQKLYSMSNPHASHPHSQHSYAHRPQAIGYPQPYIGFVAPPSSVLYYAPYPQTPPIVTSSAAFVPPQYPSRYIAPPPSNKYQSMPAANGTLYYPQPYGVAAVNMPPKPQLPLTVGTSSSLAPASPAASTDVANPNSAVIPVVARAHSTTSLASTHGGNAGVYAGTNVGSGSTATSAVMRRQTPPAVRQQRPGADLIDLNQEDDSRVSVLEAFDPLLNEHDAGNDDASDCTSYYAEYDPFDYLYSGGSTQCSDPVYEAVNKLDKSAISPNVSAIGWRQEFTADAASHGTVSTSSSLHSLQSLRTAAPPLPPRNSAGIVSQSPITNSYFSLKNYAAQAPNAATSTPLASGGAATERRGEVMRLAVTDKSTADPELLEFYHMVKELRLRYLHDDELTNVGHIIASEFNYYYPLETSIKILVHPALDALFPGASCLTSAKSQFRDYGAPVIFTCDITTAVEMIIGQAFCSLEGQIRGTVNDYAVKPVGVSEWLSPSSKLCQLECVHTSLKLERDVQLGLCRKCDENMRTLARTEIDDLRDAKLRPEDILPNEMATTITYDSMMILIETLETEIEKLESNAGDTNSRSILSCSGVVQGVKAICLLLGEIDTIEIGDCIEELKRCCFEHQTKYGSPPAQSNPEIVNDCGDYAEVSLRPRSPLELIKLKCNKLREAVQKLIELYSHVFRVAFSVQSVSYPPRPKPISEVPEPIVVSVNCVHRPPQHWRYDYYSLGVQINYGTISISSPVVTKCSNDTSGGFFPRLNFSSWLTFDKNLVCTLPRESRLIFVLYGKQTAEHEPNTDTNGERVGETTELGWCAIQLFDHKREMICGSYLLSVWPATADKFLGPAPARGCHPKPDTCPVLSIEIPSYGGRIQFPEPLEFPPAAPRYDFNSLDKNLQQELLDTAEQGYLGATDKREVFWEKRLYLQSFPNALPKVLHAAHSWDYASVMDLHSLLSSWAPLSPLQALELILPRYPDAKVREKAVEWISYLPNDQLVDFLPQLLQALKHDTYEASPMARFLLCKCLESPRIAHHTYWLLVHSLPGDDPQNSIDDSSVANEFDESLITQARYYRRNKMMLRALLAVCGEKLLARFLRQNMMCKKLAETADLVKEAKESARQKELCRGMKRVHEELVDKPTSLPLGPELEVSGVLVQNCSYFNSNTLPLKISYVGPDAERLPAIFKSGDDLQQDMLTIQLIRVMNKMWLDENLDLKMVTFNCVPTGYKKGMIELVSEAETLRKIQVEYGLTGSFKDRPIAEWLAKQNPSQLEYQRAVKNFTVSCAGYSVATYILGICDRHNDNIMLKTSGHLFHIDFGKFLGDAQMFGNFKRDRTPFVLTSDMAYVINGGDKPSTDFHYFVDLCCRAFNIIRKHGDLLLHMLALMATAGIPGVTAKAVIYVREALLPSQSNPEAAASFAKMIQFSLKSWFTQFNFFLHNLAQMRFTNDEGSGELLSFVPREYTLQQDGRLKTVMVVRCQKHYDMEKYYTYILLVTRHSQPDPTHLFRSYKEFTELYQKLCLHFPLAKLHSLPSGVHVGRSNVKSVAEKRLREIREFLESLFNSADEIAHSNLVYTFFHPLLRDQQEAKLEVSKVREVKQHREILNEGGQIKISLQYRRGALTVMIHHAKGLPKLQGGQEPNTYVKCYLKPDATKVTKRKTKVVRKTCVPSFMETLEYRMPIEHINHRLLHVTVWSHDALQENELLGGFQIDLSQYDLTTELIDWFRLGAMSRNS